MAPSTTGEAITPSSFYYCLEPLRLPADALDIKRRLAKAHGDDNRHEPKHPLLRSQSIYRQIPSLCLLLVLPILLKLAILCFRAVGSVSWSNGIVICQS
jgi:hypothetical protein